MQKRGVKLLKRQERKGRQDSYQLQKDLGRTTGAVEAGRDEGGGRMP